MRIVFLGTPDFAAPSLNALYERGNSLCVFTQPDREQRRGHKLCPPPIKTAAQALNLPVYQFEKLRCPEGVSVLREFNPDLMVTAAYGQILNRELLSIAPNGVINVHASLLPKYRGAAPIQAAIIAGETVTGVTTMMTDIGLDTGDILIARETQILPDETMGELTERLAQLGAETLLETLDLLELGRLTRTPQDEVSATKCQKIDKADARIDFKRGAQQIHNLVRGMNPSPCAHCMCGDTVMRVWKTRIRHDVDATKYNAGAVILCSPKEGLVVAAGDSTALEIVELQLPNSKVMTAKAAINGKKLQCEALV